MFIFQINIESFIIIAVFAKAYNEFVGAHLHVIALRQHSSFLKKYRTGLRFEPQDVLLQRQTHYHLTNLILVDTNWEVYTKFCRALKSVVTFEIGEGG